MGEECTHVRTAGVTYLLPVITRFTFSTDVGSRLEVNEKGIFVFYYYYSAYLGVW